jgi:hypothetical protein
MHAALLTSPFCAAVMSVCSLQLLADSNYWYVMYQAYQVLAICLQHPDIGKKDVVLKVVPDERQAGYQQVSTAVLGLWAKNRTVRCHEASTLWASTSSRMFLSQDLGSLIVFSRLPSDSRTITPAESSLSAAEEHL